MRKVTSALISVLPALAFFGALTLAAVVLAALRDNDESVAHFEQPRGNVRCFYLMPAPEGPMLPLCRAQEGFADIARLLPPAPSAPIKQDCDSRRYVILRFSTGDEVHYGPRDYPPQIERVQHGLFDAISKRWGD